MNQLKTKSSKVYFDTPTGKLSLKAIQNGSSDTKTLYLSTYLDLIIKKYNKSQVIRNVDMNAKDKISIVTRDGIDIQLRADHKNDELIKLLKARNDVTWHEVVDQYKSWNENHESLGSGLALLIAIAISAFLPGVGIGLCGAIMTAGLKAIATQAAIGIISNKGDIGATLENMVSGDSLRSTAIQMASAGLAYGIGDYFKINLTPETDKLIDHAKSGLVHASANFVAEGVLSGDGIGEVLKNSVRTGIIKTAGSYVSAKIGMLYSGKIDPKTKEVIESSKKLNWLTHKLTHGVVGGVSSKVMGKDVVSGIMGAIVAEIATELYHSGAVDRVIDNVLEKTKQEGREPTKKDFEEAYKKEIRNSAIVGKMTGVSAAIVSGQDANTSYMTASTAVDNNFVFTSTAVTAYYVTCAMWTAYDTYQTYQTEGVKAALNQLVIDGLITFTVAKGYTVGKKVYKLAKEAWKAVVKTNPVLKTTVRKASEINRNNKKVIETIEEMKKNFTKIDKINKIDNIDKKIKALEALVEKIDSKTAIRKISKIAKNITTKKKVVTKTSSRSTPTLKIGEAFPKKPLPIDKYGNKISYSNRPHTQLGTKIGRKETYPQAREFGKNGKLVRDIHFTNHGKPFHANHHQHKYIPNKTKGSLKRGPAESIPLKTSKTIHGITTTKKKMFTKTTSGIFPSKHSVHQRITRNFKTSDVLKALKKPINIKPIVTDSQGKISQKYVGEKLVAVINPGTRKIVTIHPHPRSSKKFQNKQFQNKLARDIRKDAIREIKGVREMSKLNGIPKNEIRTSVKEIIEAKKNIYPKVFDKKFTDHLMYGKRFGNIAKGLIIGVGMGIGDSVAYGNSNTNISNETGTNYLPGGNDYVVKRNNNEMEKDLNRPRCKLLKRLIDDINVDVGPKKNSYGANYIKQAFQKYCTSDKVSDKPVIDKNKNTIISDDNRDKFTEKTTDNFFAGFENYIR